MSFFESSSVRRLGRSECPTFGTECLPDTPAASRYSDESIRHLAFELMYRAALEDPHAGQGSTTPPSSHAPREIVVLLGPEALGLGEGRRAALPMGQSYPKVLFDVDRDELSEPLRSVRLCQLLFDECVVFLCRQVHDAPQIQRV